MILICVIGAATYLISPVDYAANPLLFFLSLSRYKVKDTYSTPQMLEHGMAVTSLKGYDLQETKNLMITFDGRPKTDIFGKLSAYLATSGLERSAINYVYSHVLNPMITTRSYMCIEPIRIFLDLKELRRGFLSTVTSGHGAGTLLLQDSGMVPVSTQIAIVNPVTQRLCHDSEYGEIWVSSEACATGFYGSKDPFDAERLCAKTVDGDRNLLYMRTGDLGFLRTVTQQANQEVESVNYQVLFVLGSIGDTFEVAGLNHFPIDIETTVERSHRDICPGGW